MRPPGPAPTAAQRSWAERLGRALPSRCAVCRSWPSAEVCADCLGRFAAPRPRCPGCALAWAPQPDGPQRCPSCLKNPLTLDACLAALDYGFPWADLLTQLKFHQQSGWAGFFAARLQAAPGVAELLRGLSPNEWVLPLPLSQERLGERGFNQAWELARRLHRDSRSPAGLDAGLLLRLRHTPPQSELDRAQRLQNVRGAFAVDPLRTRLLQGRRVVLVDDVMTSGASLSSAAQALKAAGARWVGALVAARTPP